MVAPVEVRERVRWSDVDIMGVVRYDRYLRFCEAAETEFFRARGFTYEALAHEHGVWLARVHVAIDYRSAARLDDVVVTRPALVKIGASSLRFTHTVEREDGTRLADAVFVIAAVDTTALRPARLPGPLRVALGA